jgi:hypothetical protein
MKNLTVYQQMTASTAQLIKTVSTEIGVKCCQPFAVRAFDALNELQLKTETEAKKAANVFLDNLQTLVQGGIISEDYDKLDLVKRGNVITISARVQALIRAFKRKGFTVIDTVVAVPNGEDIYFEEDYRDGNIIYLLKDKRLTTDREITAERLVSNYFNKFLCRLEIRNLKDNQVIMTVTEMSNSEIMNAQSSSDKGIFLSEWKGVVDKNGNPVYADKAKTRQKKVKVFYDGTGGREKKLDTESLWVKWTSEMVRKTIIRRALKNIKEAIPELAPTIMAFDTEYNIGETENTPTQENIIDVVGIDENVDLTNLTEEQQQDVNEVYDIYVANPASAKEDAERLKTLYETGKPTNEIINENYAELVNLSKSKNLYPLIENIIKGVAYEKVKN